MVIEVDDSALVPLLIVRELLGLHRFDERNLPVFGDELRRRTQSARMDGRESDLTITDTVNGLEASESRRSRPFRLLLEVLPFAGAGMWRVTRTRYLVRLDLRRDRSAFATSIRPVVEGLARGSA